VSFATITLCVASQRVFSVVFYFVIDSVRKLLDKPSYIEFYLCLLAGQFICSPSGEFQRYFYGIYYILPQ
jgi:hypothetical protein